MASHNAKKERNDEIKRLSESGVRQSELSKRYGIHQSRISAIIHDRLPPYHYCRYCNAISGAYGVCRPCKEKVAKRVAKRVALNAKRRANIAKLKTELRIQREREREEKELAKIVERIELSKIRSEKYRKTKEIYPEVWMSQGRDRTRFLVRLRDNFTCQDCGLVRTTAEVAEANKKEPGSMKSLDVHHVEGLCGKKSRGYDSINDLSGLITLCHKCHFNRPEHTQRKKSHK